MLVVSERKTADLSVTIKDIDQISNKHSEVNMDSTKTLKVSDEITKVEADNIEVTAEDIDVEAPPDWTGCVRLVCISDTHGTHREITVPPGDVLIHSGDFTNRGTLEELEDFDDWLGELPHVEKIVIPGNHDTVMDKTVRQFVKEKEGGGIYLRWKEWDEGGNSSQMIKNGKVLINQVIEVEGLKIFGFPHTLMGPKAVHPTKNDDVTKYVHAFGCSSDEELKNHLKYASKDIIDVVVSHSPGRGIGDEERRKCHSSKALRDWVMEAQPLLHVFGHVHKHGGKVFQVRGEKTTFVNAAMIKVSGIDNKCPVEFEDLFRRPVIVDICKKTKEIKFPKLTRTRKSLSEV